MLLKLISLIYQHVLVLKVKFTSNEIQNKLNFMEIPVCFSALLANMQKTSIFMHVFIQIRVQKNAAYFATSPAYFGYVRIAFVLLFDLVFWGVCHETTCTLCEYFILLTQDIKEFIYSKYNYFLYGIHYKKPDVSEIHDTKLGHPSTSKVILLKSYRCRRRDVSNFATTKFIIQNQFYKMCYQKKHLLYIKQFQKHKKLDISLIQRIYFIFCDK